MAKWEGETYAVGTYDVALAMLARASDLKAAGIRVATVEKPWTKDEFQDALTKLKALGKWEYPLDMGTAGTGEWLPYAYSPFLQSFGGDLINRDGFQSAEGASMATRPSNGPSGSAAWPTRDSWPRRAAKTPPRTS